MSFYSIPLKAGIPFKQGTSGSLLLIDSIGAAAGIDVKITRIGGNDGNTMPNRQTAFRLVEPFEGVTFTSTVDTVLGVFLSNSDVQLGFVSGGAVAIPGGVSVTNDAAHPVNVTFTQQVVPLGSVKVSNLDAEAVPVVQKIGAEFKVRSYQAQAVANVAPAAVTAVASVFLALDATRRGFRIKNNGANPVAIGGAGLTFANAAVLIQPGETWNENEAAGAAWSCICDAALASTLNIQTIA